MLFIVQVNSLKSEREPFLSKEKQKFNGRSAYHSRI